jgi:hypothetical protein
MGTVDAQLMGATCLGIEGDEKPLPCPLPREGKELVVRHCPLTVFHIHHLARTVHRVGTQRKRNGARPLP